MIWQSFPHISFKHNVRKAHRKVPTETTVEAERRDTPLQTHVMWLMEQSAAYCGARPPLPKPLIPDREQSVQTWHSELTCATKPNKNIPKWTAELTHVHKRNSCELYSYRNCSSWADNVKASIWTQTEQSGVDRCFDLWRMLLCTKLSQTVKVLTQTLRPCKHKITWF